MFGKEAAWLKQKKLLRVAGDDERIPAYDLTRSLAATVVGEAGLSELLRQSRME